ncbi:MAG: transcriptional repressor LexA [Phycisphaerales bacterium]|nr:transcriptional repressor LexA [Phycisphaerales bacterium]
MPPKRRKTTKSSRPSPKRTRSRMKRTTRPATPRQTEILTFVRNYAHKHGYSPTYDEIAVEFSISKVTVFEHLNTLEGKGLLRREKHKARSLHLAEHLELPDDKPSCLPLVGRIAAGAPIEAIEDREVLDLESLFLSRHEVYVLQVKGDSMIEDQIADGDYVVVEKRKTPYNGEVVVAYLDEDEEATLKRYYREKGRIRLQPANSAYKPIYATSVDIQGIVIGVIRRVN